jgi:hypothetical protein
MNTPKKILSCLIMFIFQFATLFSSQAEGQLPTKWVSGMVFTVSSEGGLTEFSETTVIGIAGALVTTRLHGNETKATIPLTKKELNGFLKSLSKYRFNKIKTIRRTDVVNDMVTTEYSFKWKGGSHFISIGATNEIGKGYKNALAGIDAAIAKLMQNKNAE